MLRALLPALLMSLTILSDISAQDPTRVVRAVTAGMACKQAAAAAQLECEYRVGRDLRFTIAGVGGDDAGITFLKVDWDGDYYATFGVLHGCVVVKEGKRIVDALPKDGAVLPEFAFVSPKTGKVYTTWQSCQRGT